MLGLRTLARAMDDEPPVRAARKVAAPQTFGALIRGVHTDFAVSRFNDNTFIAITQAGKLGTVLQVQEVGTLSGGRHGIQVLMGQRENDLVALYADQIAQAILPRCRTPLVLSLAMKNQQPNTEELGEILAALTTSVKW